MQWYGKFKFNTGGFQSPVAVEIISSTSAFMKGSPLLNDPSLSTVIVIPKFCFLKDSTILHKWHFNLRPFHKSISQPSQDWSLKNLTRVYIPPQPFGTKGSLILQKANENHHLIFGGCQLRSRWWFQLFFIFTPTWGNDPVWLIFFKWVGSTTNQRCSWHQMLPVDCGFPGLNEFDFDRWSVWTLVCTLGGWWLEVLDGWIVFWMERARGTQGD